MTCLQHLWHSLACTAQRKRSGERLQRAAQKGKGKRIPWWAERVQQGVIYCPCTKNIDTAEVAKLFFTHVFPRFGLHSKVISDRGPQFTSAFTRELTRLLQYDVALSTMYHPQMDGETERVNQELETYLRPFTANQPEEWSSLLPMAESLITLPPIPPPKRLYSFS